MVLLWQSADAATSCCDGWKHHRCAHRPLIAKGKFSKAALQISSTKWLVGVHTGLTNNMQAIIACYTILPYDFKYSQILTDHLTIDCTMCYHGLPFVIASSRLFPMSKTPRSPVTQVTKTARAAASDLFAPQAP